MQISSITIQNFRCFGPNRVSAPLDRLTAFVGANGCGKTALLQALSRLFGVQQSERTLLPDDFHLPPGIKRESLALGDTLSLVIEATLIFPELGQPGAPAVAECFSQMMVNSPGSPPYCRVRLEGTWTRSNLPDGEVEQHIYWIDSPEEEPNDDHKRTMPAHDRSLIHVHYVPAARDPSKQIRYVSGSMINRLLKAVAWSPGTESQIEAASAAAQNAFATEAGVTRLHVALNSFWKQLNVGPLYSEVALQPVARRLEDMLRQLQAVFLPTPHTNELELDRLSDGLKSLFYFSLVVAGLAVEADAALGSAATTGFNTDAIWSPALTVIAVEEPENHVAPHYLGRVLKVLRSALKRDKAQILLTSHSPCIMERVAPEEVRHVRLDPATMTATVKPIAMPASGVTAHKFVREAVLAYPELYFSRLVVLGEGDSEQIVLKKIFTAMGVEADLSFVSIVPLGGRHVNHFWRLLRSLGIPHVTLLDFDQERYGGAWSRVHYALTELVACGIPRDKVLAVAGGGVLSETEFAAMRSWEIDETSLNSWLGVLEGYGVFFSRPLDLDFLMQRHYPAAYQVVPVGAKGLTIPAPTDAASYADVVRAVLKPEGGDGRTYSAAEREAFFWYRYLFLGRGKPVTHLDALSRLTDAQLKAGCPEALKRLAAQAKIGIEKAAKDEVDAD